MIDFFVGHREPPFYEALVGNRSLFPPLLCDLFPSQPAAAAAPAAAPTESAEDKKKKEEEAKAAAAKAEEEAEIAALKPVQHSEEDFSGLDTPCFSQPWPGLSDAPLLCTAMAWILIPAYCFALP